MTSPLPIVAVGHRHRVARVGKPRPRVPESVETLVGRPGVGQPSGDGLVPRSAAPSERCFADDVVVLEEFRPDPEPHAADSESAARPTLLWLDTSEDPTGAALVWPFLMLMIYVVLGVGFVVAR